MIFQRKNLPLANSFGKKEGIYKSYHDNGQLWEEINYINGKMNGIYKSYYSNGELEFEVNYIDDIKIEN